MSFTVHLELIWINVGAPFPATIRSPMRPSFVHALVALLAALTALPAQGAAPLARPRFASLQIELWPEYDRPQTLVILKGELAADAALPATLALRIPAAAGAPSAVAYADASGNLLNLPYDRAPAGQFVLVRLTTPQRSFHLEFYDPLVSSDASREYRYDWLGDFAVERLGVLVKEPAGATDLSVSPALASVGASPDGLKYRAAEFGPLKVGETMPVALAYKKADPRPSIELLRSAPAGAVPPGRDPKGLWLIALGVAGLAVASGALFVSARRRKQVAPAGACPKCGKEAVAGSRFCSSCGAPLKA